MTRRNPRIVLKLLGLLLLALPAGVRAQEASLIYLVRHAEQATDDPRDPNLSQAGRVRALLLASMLEDADIETIYSTDYNRTQQTAGPLAESLGLDVMSYDPRGEAFREFAMKLRRDGGRVLVVGHSNTTPELVEMLGGAPGEPVEESEYDRLYIVVVNGGVATTSMIRFGESTH